MSYPTVYIWPEVDLVNDLGEAYRGADLTADPLRRVPTSLAPVTAHRSSGAADSLAEYHAQFRTFPAGALARIYFDGREWDVVGDPHRQYGSPGTAHVTVRLRARTPEAL